MNNQFGTARRRGRCGVILRLALLGVLSFSLQAFGQGLSLGSQGISQQDIDALRGSAGMVGGGLSGATGVGGILGSGWITAPDSQQNDLMAKDAEQKTSQTKNKPLAPNEFQKYVLEVTGNFHPLYGSDFFDNTQNSGVNLANAPVSDDYVLGAGDQLQIRVWGSTSGETAVTIDRNGQISLPKLGTLTLAGVKASQAQALIKSLFARIYKDFDLSVTLGRLRKITVYVVGQSRAPGSYALSSQATLTTGLFASGGPNANGSIRRVQLKRNGAVVTEFDLYAFLSRGDKSADVKLMDGDVIVFPRAGGYMALTGKVNAPGIYELKDASDTLGDFLNLAGGLAVVADPRRVSLERLQPALDQPRSIEEFSLDAQALKRGMKNGDLVTVAAIIPELANGVTLRGNVAQPTRMAWRAGLRISDVITRKALLISPDSVRRQNEVLFDGFQEERAARNRARVPLDLAAERSRDQTELDARAKDKATAAQAAMPIDELNKLKSDSLLRSDQNGTASSDPGKNKSFVSEETLVDRIGNLVDEVNLDYAVVERMGRDDLRVTLIPFNLGRVLADSKDPDNLLLEAGDVLTVFSVKDLRVPLSRRRVFVRIEGEVNKPGVYPVLPGETLSNIIKKAGGTTPDAYLYGMGFYRDDVRKAQRENLDKLLRRLESESAGSLAQVSQSLGASADVGVAQSKVQALQLAQRQSMDRARSLRPEGRIALGLPAVLNAQPDLLPDLRLQNGDRIFLPARPDFVYIYGSVNTESALLFKQGLTVTDYLQLAGTSTGADRDGVILIRADGSALTSQGFWRNEVLTAHVMPGDTIVMPEKLDRESGWSYFIRNTKDITQVFYQLGLGAAAIKTLRQ